MSSAEAETRRFRITSESEAIELVDATLSILDELEPLIETETKLFKAGKVKDALALALEKNAAAQTYTRCLEGLRHNAVAIGRFQPPRLEELRHRHQSFGERMALNLAVISTTRTVSEGLVRELASAVSQTAGPTTYTRGNSRQKPATAPLVLSRQS